LSSEENKSDASEGKGKPLMIIVAAGQRRSKSLDREAFRGFQPVNGWQGEIRERPTGSPGDLGRGKMPPSLKKSRLREKDDKAPDAPFQGVFPRGRTPTFPRYP